MDQPIYKLAAVGDVMLDREVGRHFRRAPEDYSLPELAEVMGRYDLVFANLENPVGIRGTPDPVQRPHITFRCHPDTLQVLRSLRVSVVSLGNNHMLDYGGEALAETLEHLDANGIRHVGAGRNYREANEPLLLEINGKKVAILSYVFIYSASTAMATRTRPGVSDHRIRKILPRIRDLARQGYQVLVSLHWGLEYSFFPIPYQMAQARRMIDSGASLIIGHGPHYPQGIESYGGGKIIYSLGNFIFDEPFKFANRSFVYGVGVGPGNQLTDEVLHPVHIREQVPIIVQGAEKRNIERLVARLSQLYVSKSKRFWQDQNAMYFGDIVYRALLTKSWKYVRLPPPSFYWGVGLRNYARKLLFGKQVRNMLSRHCPVSFRRMWPMSDA
jgi:poly-gamma-glutamate capsule biosynthesis protein CapA/YwtB (metallophosphatase superfamily)